MTSGVGGHDYDPAGDVSRGQMATFIAGALAASGAQLPASPTDAFGDDDGNTHETAINQLAQSGVISGISEDHYAAADGVTRGQMATFLAAAWEARVGDGHAAYPPADPVPVAEVTGCSAEGADVTIAGRRSARWHERDLDAGTAIDARGAVCGRR